MEKDHIINVCEHYSDDPAQKHFVFERNRSLASPASNGRIRGNG